MLGCLIHLECLKLFTRSSHALIVEVGLWLAFEVHEYWYHMCLLEPNSAGPSPWHSFPGSATKHAVRALRTLPAGANV